MSHKGNDEIIDNESDNIMTCQEYNGTGESIDSLSEINRLNTTFNTVNFDDEKYIEGEHHDLTTYYQLIKQFEYLLESENYQDQVYSFIIGHFEKHLTEDLLQELKDSLRL
jgi:uncharacterized protein YfkK (UPF0435 family)